MILAKRDDDRCSALPGELTLGWIRHGLVTHV